VYDGTEGVGGAGASAGEVSRTRSGLVLQRVQPAWAARARRGREVGGAAPAGAWLTAGAYTRPQLCSTGAVFVTEI
jgi:hypothetical protein